MKVPATARSYWCHPGAGHAGIPAGMSDFFTRFFGRADRPGSADPSARVGRKQASDSINSKIELGKQEEDLWNNDVTPRLAVTFRVNAGMLTWR